MRADETKPPNESCQDCEGEKLSSCGGEEAEGLGGGGYIFLLTNDIASGCRLIIV